MEAAVGGGGASGAGEVKWSAAVVGYDIKNTAGGKPHATYVIDISVSTEHIVIQRRYSAFKRLSEELARTFPRASLPPIPGAGSFGRSLDDAYLTRKQEALNSWLQAVIDVPQLAKSPMLLEFLKDDESESTLDPNRTAVGLLVQPLDYKEQGVKAKAKFKKRLSVPAAGHVVIWEFSTLANDIGFSVSFDGETAIEHARYKSHEQLVQGSFTAPRGGVCMLVWDNSYSRMRSKVLKYRAMVVDADAAAAGAAAEEAAKAKIRSRRSVAELLRPRTVRSSVAQVDEGMVARAHRDQALSELQDAAEQRKELERTVEELRSKLANAELECKSEVHKRRVVEDKLRGVETALAEAKVAGEGLTGEKHAWGVARAELQSKLDRATADIERLTKERDDALLRAQVTAESIRKAMQERDEAVAAQKASAKEVAQLKDQLATAQDAERVAAMTARVAELEARTREAEETAAASVRASEAATAKATKAAARLVKSNKVLEEKVSKLRGQKKLLVNEVKSARAAAAQAAKEAAATAAASNAAVAAAVTAAAAVRDSDAASVQSAPSQRPRGGSASSGPHLHTAHMHRHGDPAPRGTPAVGRDGIVAASPPSIASSSVHSYKSASQSSSIGARIAAVASNLGAHLSAVSPRHPRSGDAASGGGMDTIVRVRSWSGGGAGDAAQDGSEAAPNASGSRPPHPAGYDGRGGSQRQLGVASTPVPISSHQRRSMSGSAAMQAWSQQSHARGSPQSSSGGSPSGSAGGSAGARALLQDTQSHNSARVGGRYAARPAGVPPPSPDRGVVGSLGSTTSGPVSQAGTLSPASSARGSMRSLTGGRSAHASMAAASASVGLGSRPGTGQPQVPLHRHRFWRFEPLFAGGDPSKMRPTDVQVWSFPLIHSPRTVDPRNAMAVPMPGARGPASSPSSGAAPAAGRPISGGRGGGPGGVGGVTSPTMASRRRASLAPGMGSGSPYAPQGAGRGAGRGRGAPVASPDSRGVPQARRRRSDFGVSGGIASPRGLTAVLYTSFPEPPEVQGSEEHRMRMVFGQMAGGVASGGGPGAAGSPAAARGGLLWSPGSARSSASVGRSPLSRSSRAAPAPAQAGSKKTGGGLWSSITKGVKGLVDELELNPQQRSRKYPRFNVMCTNCHTAPLRSAHYRCSVCSNYALCERCYRIGAHGFENAPGSLGQRMKQLQERHQHEQAAAREQASAAASDAASDGDPSSPARSKPPADGTASGAAGDADAAASPSSATARDDGGGGGGAAHPAGVGGGAQPGGGGRDATGGPAQGAPAPSSPTRDPARSRPRTNSLMAVTAIS